jgi:hypothetical protein
VLLAIVRRPEASSRLLDLIALGLSVAALGAVVIGGVDPTAWRSPSHIHSPFRLVTGLPDPFCGLTHSLLALGQGRLLDSVELNPLGPLVAVVSFMVATAVVRAISRGSVVGWPARCVRIGAGVVIVVWAVQLVRAIG